MKKILLLVSVVFILCAMFFIYQKNNKKSLYISTHHAKSLNYTKKIKPIFVWDLHQVLFQRPFLSMLKRGISNIENKPLFFKQFLSACCNKTIRTKIHNLKERKITVSQAYFDSIQEYPHAYQQLIFLANNIYKPNKELFAFIKNLQEQGYQNYIFSNIGPLTLLDLQKKYPLEFSYFTSPLNTINSTQPSNNSWVCKPEVQAYSTMLKKIKAEECPERVIFIDDRIKNIKEAHKNEINGILFISTEQVIHDCTTLLNEFKT